MTTVGSPAVPLTDQLVGRFLFPGTNRLLNRRGIWSSYRSSESTEALARDELRALQLEKLKAVVAEARRWSPFYARRCREVGLEAGDIRRLEDLQSLPALSRADLRDHRAELVDSRLSASVRAADRSSRRPGEPIQFAAVRRHKLVRNCSTGSTGSPVVFYDDGSTVAASWAYELTIKRWFGVHPGAREARFARVSTEYVASSRALRLRQCLWNQLILPGMNLAPADYDAAVRRLRRFRPKVLFGITTALTGLCRYLEQEGVDLSPCRPDLIVTWASPMFDHERRQLERTFGCTTTNLYGSREVGHVAGVCPRGRLHVNQEHYLVEIEPRPDGSTTETGQLLVTPLFRTPMPLLRYRIGDVGEISRGDCDCGRRHMVLKTLLGRTAEVYTTAGGRVIAPNFWCRAFMGRLAHDAVEQFQVILERDGGVEFRIVRRDGYTPETEASLRRYIADQLQDGTPRGFRYVLAIDPQPSGKFQMVVNNRANHASGSRRASAGATDGRDD